MIAAFLCLVSGMLMHPAAESLAEMQWNTATDRLEIALRLRITDEQQFIRSVTEESVDSLLEDGEAFGDAAISVLERRLGFGNLRELNTRQDAAKLQSKYHWVGRRSEGGHAWWFFEVTPAGGRPTHLRCTLFEKRSRDADVRDAASHDHVHAIPVSTFLVLPDAKPAGETPVAGAADSPPPHSFAVTPEHPITEIEWTRPEPSEDAE
ncbi:DUF6702 family protein [Aporhodopirellula aestuarii]|uniref:Secreted protein n=1 Tax=Aporhodopirellula aestuarii TaxID=2950107 RepID=A0ABT0TXR4_9BACT|nr:DUF6702 family protein [Aporhodopirellula aestuarii]MCM2369393.1 hypothetical protein [Aporhodopirellula aestuarii]